MSPDKTGAKSLLGRVKHVFKGNGSNSGSTEQVNTEDGPTKSIVAFSSSKEPIVAPSFLPSVGASQGTAESGFIEHQPYYHGFLPRDDAHVLLEKPGDFLVRQTDVNQHGRAFVISVRWAMGNIEHIVLYRNREDEKWMGYRESRFDTIPQMVDYYRKHPINDKGAHLLHGIPRQKWQLYNDQIHLEKRLGSGQFGEVWLGAFKSTMTSTPVPVAVKLLRAGAASKKDDRVQFIKEAHLSQSFHHANVVRVFGVAMQKEPIMIVMELANGGSLLKLLREHGTTLSLAYHIQLAMEAARGMEYLEKMKCIHRDVAARNCLMSFTDNKQVVKISDFGLSTIGDATIDDPTTKMAIRWLAPEVLRDFVFSHKSDVWAFGVLLYEIFSDGAEPYAGFSNQEVRDNVTFMYRMEVPPATPKHVAELIRDCWRQNPRDRPDFHHVYKRLKKCFKMFH
uniref:Tyrosine-protein kinase n=1 Tax=Steinernema glaseri TaxID=37863 RepID=A0A1I7ZUM5_9BILA